MNEEVEEAVFLVFRVHPKLKKAVEKCAEADDRPVAGWLRKVVAEAVEQEKRR